MSSQRGNVSRTRKQKYQNKSSFKNDRNDKTLKIQKINNMTQEGICHHCKSVIEWKIKYKKYKPLTQPAACILCQNKTVKRAYHKVCQPCAEQAGVCAKCNEKKKIEKSEPSEEEKRADEAAARFELMHLPERKRRTVLRFIEKGGRLEDAGISKEDEEEDFLDDYFKDSENEDDVDDNSDS